MVVQKNRKRILILIVIIALSLFGLGVLRLFAPHTYTFSTDTYLTKPARKNLTDLCQKYLATHGPHACKICNLLQSSFPTIKNIYLTRRDIDTVHTHITCKAPWVVIAHEPYGHYIVTLDGDFTDSTTYHPDTYQGQPTLYVAHSPFTKKVQRRIYTWLTKNALWLKHYIPHWKKETKIILQDPHNTHAIITKADAVITQTLQRQIESLYKKYTYPIIIDTRFGRKLVVKKWTKGGL